MTNSGSPAALSPEERRRNAERICAIIASAQLMTRPVIPERADLSKPMRDRRPVAQMSESESAAVEPSGAGSAGGKGPPPQKPGAPPSGPNPQRPVIQLAGGKLPDIVDKAEAALIDSKPEFYRYGGQLMRPVVEELPAADMSCTKVHRLVPVTRPYLIEAFTKVAQWQKFDRRSSTWIDIDCPNQAAETYLAREGEWRLQPLVGIINAPMLRADGSLLDRPGYDARTGLLFRSDGTQFEPVPKRPTRDDAERAMRLLEDSDPNISVRQRS